jgi:hypothetical protein
VPATTLVIKLCVGLPARARRGSRKERACRIQTPSPPRDPLPRTSHTAVSGAHCRNLAPPHPAGCSLPPAQAARPASRAPGTAAGAGISCPPRWPAPVMMTGREARCHESQRPPLHTRGCGEATAPIKRWAGMAQLFAAMRENHPPSTVHLSGLRGPARPARASRVLGSLLCPWAGQGACMIHV